MRLRDCIAAILGDAALRVGVRVAACDPWGIQVTCDRRSPLRMHAAIDDSIFISIACRFYLQASMAQPSVTYAEMSEEERLTRAADPRFAGLSSRTPGWAADTYRIAVQWQQNDGANNPHWNESISQNSIWPELYCALTSPWYMIGRVWSKLGLPYPVLVRVSN